MGHPTQNEKKKKGSTQNNPPQRDQAEEQRKTARGGGGEKQRQARKKEGRKNREQNTKQKKKKDGEQGRRRADPGLRSRDTLCKKEKERQNQKKKKKKTWLGRGEEGGSGTLSSRGGDRNDGKEPTAECLANERCGLQEDRSCGLQEGGPARSVSTESIKWSKVSGRRGGSVWWAPSPV